jgi:D-alanyl-D-alanine carboxypeptidase
MENTSYPTNNELPGELHGYHADIASVELVDTTILNPAPLGGSGAMISDIWDLKTWAEAVCTGKLLKPETHRARLQTPASAEYGEGLVKMGPFCGHGGEVFGFNSAMWYLPQRDATIVISINRTGPFLPAETLARTIMKILFPKHASW